MSGKFSFHLGSPDGRRQLPPKVIVGQRENESNTHVLLKLLGFLIFHRERLRIEVNLHNDNIPFEPDIVELDYELRPKLWIECGDCGVQKLDRLAVKVPEAEIWVLKKSRSEAEQLCHAMTKAGLRRNRYHLMGFDNAMMEELLEILRPRNQVLWVLCDCEPPALQFDFNGLWFDTTFSMFHH